jgi:hypothetical protein
MADLRPSLLVHAPFTLPHLVGRARFAARQALREVWRWLGALVDREAPPVLHLFESPTAGAPMRLLLSRPGLIEDRLVAERVWEPHIRDLIRFHLPKGRRGELPRSLPRRPLADETTS